MPSDPAASANSEFERENSCRQLTARVVAIKQILVESYRLQGYPVPLIREAIGAAEAEAWLSGFPHLFLPELADEMLRRRSENRVSGHPGFAQAA